MSIDPVCGMKVDPARAAGTFDYNGTTYHFCSVRCRERFSQDPAAFLAKGPVGMAEAAVHVPLKPGPATKSPDTRRATTYTCPMHPEIVQDGPGPCPKC